MEPALQQIWHILETDPGHRGLTRDVPRPDLRLLGQSLLDATEVWIVSGFPVQQAGGAGETDGPVGAVHLAAALQRLDKSVCILTDESVCAPILAACERFAPRAEVFCVPKKGAQLYCYSLLHRRSPSHIIAIERPGKGADGHYHNFRGEWIDSMLADTDLLLYAPQVVTVGIGDGGNELGMGALRPMIEQKVDKGALVCAQAQADFTLTAGVSNWWGWGLCAVLSLLTGQSLLPSDRQEEELLRILVAQGCVDGITGQPELTVDHLSLEENLQILRQLRQTVDSALGVPPPRASGVIR